MLVLTRKANEEILIGDNIKITLVRIKGGSVRSRHRGSTRHPRSFVVS